MGGVIEASRDGAKTLHRAIGAVRHTTAGIAAVILQRLVPIALERGIDADIGIGHAALDLAVDVQRQSRNIDRAQRKDARIARRRIRIQIRSKRPEVLIAPFEQHIQIRLFGAGALAIVFERVDDGLPAVLQQGRIGAAIEPALALQAEIALGLDVQALRRDGAADIDAAQRIDYRHLTQGVDDCAQEVQVYRRTAHQAAHLCVQRTAEGIGCPAVFHLQHPDFGDARAARALDRQVIDIQMAGLEDLHFAIRPRTNDGAVHDDGILHIHQHRRIIDDVDLGIGPGLDALGLHAADIRRVDIDRAPRRVQIRNLDIKSLEGIEVLPLGVHHLQALQLLLQGQDIGLVTRDGLRVRGVRSLHPRQGPYLFADDVLLAAIAQHGLAQIHRLEHIVNTAHLVGRELAEIPGQRALAIGVLERRRIFLPIAVAEVLGGEVQVTTIQTVVIVIIVALLDHHASADVDFDVLGTESGQLIAHVDIHRAACAVQTGRIRAQQLFDDGPHQGRVRIENHLGIVLRGQCQPLQPLEQLGRDDKDVGGIIDPGDDACRRRGGDQAGALVDHPAGQLDRRVEVQAYHLH